MLPDSSSTSYDNCIIRGEFLLLIACLDGPKAYIVDSDSFI